MIEAIGAIIATGAALVGYVLWSRKRRNDAAFETAAAQSRRPGSGGGGGPDEPA